MANVVTNPTADQSIQSHNLLPASGNPAVTGQSLGNSGASWQTSYINMKQQNAIVYADQLSGSDAFAKINAAIALLPATGGTVDARGFGATTQAVSTQLLVGAAGKPVCLIVDANTQYNISTTGGMDAIELYTGSSIVALNSTNAVTGASATFALTSSANVNSMLATYPQTGQTIVYLQGLTFKGISGATVADSLLNLVNITDMSTFRNLVVWNFFGTGIHIQCKNSVGLGPDEFR